MPSTTTVILGGGFGGIATANTLRCLVPPEHAIVVVDRTPDFFVGAGKTWMMLGERSCAQISRPRAELLTPGVRLVRGDVRRIDLPGHTVSVDEETLRWDQLVVALGADLNMNAIPGLSGAAHTFYTPDGATALHAELERFTGGEIVILLPRAPFKCPPAPYEAPPVVKAAHLTGPAGWIQVDPLTLEVKSAATTGDVFAVGDVMTLPLPGRYKPDMPLVLPKAGVLAAEQGAVVARRIAAKILGRAPEAVFDGRGYCYLEMGGGRAVRAAGAFFAVPQPVMEKHAPDELQFRDKLAWVEKVLGR